MINLVFDYLLLYTVPYLTEFRIRIHLIRIRILGLDDQKLEKFTAEKKKFWIKNYNLHIPQASIKDVKVTEEALSSQNSTSSTSKHEIS